MPVARMQVGASKPVTPHTNRRTEKGATTSQSFDAESSYEKSPGRGRKRKDISGDDEDGEYTPRKSTKKHKSATSKLDESSAAECHSTDPSQSPERGIEDSAGDGRNGNHTTVLSRESKGKGRTSTTVAFPRIDQKQNQQASPKANMGATVDALSEGLEYLGTVPTTKETRSSLLSGIIDATVEQSPSKSAAELPSLGPSSPNTLVASINSANEYPMLPPSASTVYDGAIQNHGHEPPQPRESRPAVIIRYYVILARTPRLMKDRWWECSLTGKSIDVLFDEVSRFTSEAPVERIDFTLISDNSDVRFGISRSQSELYEEMKEDFSREIKKELGKGNMDFEIWVEPNPARSVAMEANRQAGRVANADNVGFSL